MNIVKRGFLLKKNGKIKINHHKTQSILLNNLHVDLLLRSRKYIKGFLLDAGCGEKPYSLIYEDLVEKSIGCDVEYCIHEQTEVDVFATLDKLPFENDTFDTILCTNVLEHVSESVKGFSELARVLKRNGYIIISVPFLYPLHEAPHDYYRYTVYGLKHQLERNSLEIVHFVPLGGIGMLLLVYFHLFLCKFLKMKTAASLGCVLQEITYSIYKKCCLNRIIKKGVEKELSKTISSGYFVIAKKKSVQR